MYRAVRLKAPPREALRAAGLTPEEVLKIALPVLPNFSAQAFVLARDLARRAMGFGIGPDAAPRENIALPGNTQEVGGAQSEVGQAVDVPDTDAPPSPRLRAMVICDMLGV